MQIVRSSVIRPRPAAIFRVHVTGKSVIRKRMEAPCPEI